MAIKFYICVAKGLKLKVREFWEQIFTFAGDIGGNLVGGAFLAPPRPE